MKIRMTSSQKGATDGIHVTEYLAGSVYDLSDSKGARELAQAFVGARMAVEVEDEVDLDRLQPFVDVASIVSHEAIPGVEVEDEQIAPGEQIDGHGLEPVVEAPKPSGKRNRRA